MSPSKWYFPARATKRFKSHQDLGVEKKEFVLVGFTLDKKKAIGYRSFLSEGKVGNYAHKLSVNGADVISVRRVKE